MFTPRLLVCAFAYMVLAACQDPDTGLSKFRLLEASESGVHFVNAIDQSKMNILDYVNMYNGAGVGVGDFNKDGFEDLFFGGNLVPSRLYLNDGNGKAIKFVDRTEESGIHTQVWVNGVTVVDINQDGWDDIYCSVSGGRSGKDRTNKLFVHKGLDKEGVPQFEEEAEKYHLNDSTHTIQAAFFDYDGDADLDVFMIVNYPTGYLDAAANRIVPIKKIGNPDRSDRLYRNDGPGKDGHPIFTDVSAEAGITLEGFSLGVAIHDINGDGRPDVYVANDYVGNDIIYINNADGTFTDRIRDYVQHTSYSSMGIDVADINNDGLQDIMVLDMLPEQDPKLKLMYSAAGHIGFNLMKKSNYVDQYFRNTLQLNNGRIDSIPSKFSEIGHLSNVFRTNWSWSTLIQDLDLDGWRDIFITNGFSKDVNDLDFINYEQPSPFEKQEFDGEAYVESLKDQEGIYLPNYMYRNQHDLTFKDKSEDWGIVQPSYSNGATYADLDNDGDLDLVINNINERAFVYENSTISPESTDPNYLQIVLKGNDPNHRGIGTKIKFESSQGILSHEHHLTRGFMSSVSSVINFGLGQDTHIGRIDIIWPDGLKQSVHNVRSNQRITITKQEMASGRVEPVVVGSSAKIFSRPVIPGLDYKHDESDYNDFNYQILLPHKLSKFGPSLAIGDIDNNKLDDFYVGGAHGSAGRIYFQNPDGSFMSLQVEDTFQYEDQGSLLFDVDNDKDLDIYIVSGSVERGKKSPFYSDRLLINTGDRIFKKSSLKLPEENGSCVVAADYDKDGDLDLFVGGASKPGEYPLPARSMLLRNDTRQADEPILTDVSDVQLPELRNLGIVRSAIWSDYDNDGWIDLLVVGEYMPITIFKNNKGKLTKVDADRLPKERGLWNSINAGDLDRDGDIDYVLGNIGLNSRYRPSENEPITVYAKDFDNNGRIDPIMTQFTEGREVPVHLRDDLFKQLNMFKKSMPTYRQYAEAEIDDLIPRAELNEALTLKWTYSDNACMINEGNGKFRLMSLPNRAQIAPIYGTLIQDFNADNVPDILAVGNSYSPEVFSGWLDASVGMLLAGRGDHSFNYTELNKSNFYVDGDAKAIARLKYFDDTFLNLVSLNNDSLQLFGNPLGKTTKIVELQPADVKVEITYVDGKTELREFYYGSGYFSQNSRSLAVVKGMESLKIVNNLGDTRWVDLQ